MKYQIGDIVHLIDGIDYNGDSLTYTDGVDTEILGYNKEHHYTIRNFWRPVTEEEIEKLVITNAQKCEQYEKELSFYNREVFIQMGSSIFEKVTIQYYNFEYHNFMYIEIRSDEPHHFRIGEFWDTELSAYKNYCKKLLQKIKDIQEVICHQ